MLTVYYIAATWLQSWRISSILQKIKLVNQQKGSVVVQHELPPLVFRSPAIKQKLEVTSIFSNQCINKKSGNIGDLIWYSSNKRIATIFPKQILDVSGWISVIPGRTHLPIQIKGVGVDSNCDGEKMYLLVEADYNTCQYRASSPLLEIEKFGVPLAWHVAEYISLLLESDELRFASLCVSFSQNNFTLENGVQIMRIQSVETIGTPYRIFNVGSVPESYAPLGPCLNRIQRKESFMSRWRAHISMLCTFCEAVGQVKDSLQEISVRHPGSGVGAVKLIPGVCINTKENDGSPVSSQKAVEDILSEGANSGTSTTCNIESPIPSSVPSLSRLSTDVSVTPGSTRLAADSVTTSMSSLRSLPATPRRTITTSSTDDRIKPPNIIIFSDSASAAECVKVALETTLMRDRYTIHVLNFAQMLSTPWLNQACLVIVHGNVPPISTEFIINYVVETSGSLLCLCSDFLGSVLQMFHTAEVRPNELVQCSYKKWKHVPLVHHVFCYQPSPTIPQFSHDEQMSLSAIPDSVELKDKNGKLYKFKVEVLGAEETWQTPSLLLVSSDKSAKMVFSQVHLEIDPGQFESDDFNRDALEKSNKARLEILGDVLGNVLGLQCSLQQKEIVYSSAYFLGNHEVKQELIDKLKKEGILESNLELKAGNVTLKFCGKGVNPPPATSTLLPVLMHACPESFSTFDYFENLKTENIGRLVIYSDVLTTSMDIIQNVSLKHGFAVIPCYQTKGKGRGGNTWLSPSGCAMFSLQLHIPMQSNLGKYLSLLQHAISLAIVLSICQSPGLEVLDIGLKWPNDIYANRRNKIGGVLVTSIANSNTIICNIGCALNLKNNKPTICINDLIDRMNSQTSTKASHVSYEKYFANVFNKIEEILNMIESDNLEKFFTLYYTYWLHSDTEVNVKQTDTDIKKVKIKGIDSSGYLLVEASEGEELTVHPDGNSFDMMEGLIVPKFKI